MSLRSRPETLHISSPGTSQWNAGTITLVPAIAGQRIAVYGAILTPVATSYFGFRDDLGGFLSGQYYMNAGLSLVIPQNYNMDPWFITGPGRALVLYIATPGAIAGDIYYLYVL